MSDLTSQRSATNFLSMRKSDCDDAIDSSQSRFSYKLMRDPADHEAESDSVVLRPQLVQKWMSHFHTFLCFRFLGLRTKTEIPTAACLDQDVPSCQLG
eukprot:COSAG02_NODE_18699_length_924_cov_1.111515_2_plen_97_part_01